MAGSVIEEHNVSAIIARTGVREIHASLKSTVPSAMRYQNEEISMGAGKGSEYQRFVVHEQKVRSLLQAASNGEPKT